MLSCSSQTWHILTPCGSQARHVLTWSQDPAHFLVKSQKCTYDDTLGKAKVSVINLKPSKLVWPKPGIWLNMIWCICSIGINFVQVPPAHRKYVMYIRSSHNFNWDTTCTGQLQCLQRLAFDSLLSSERAGCTETGAYGEPLSLQTTRCSRLERVTTSESWTR